MRSNLKLMSQSLCGCWSSSIIGPDRRPDSERARQFRPTTSPRSRPTRRFTIAVRLGPRQNGRDARSSDSGSQQTIMRRFLSAALLALALASYASADYLLIVVNLNAKSGEENEKTGPGLGPGPIGPQPPKGPPSLPPRGGSGGGPPPMGGSGGGPPPLGGVGGTPMGGQAAPEDADDSPDLIVVVVEVNS